MKSARAFAAAVVTATLTMPVAIASTPATAATAGTMLVRLDTGGADSGYPRAINNVGMTVGWTDVNYRRQAVVWQGTRIVARPAGDLQSEATAVNDDGLVAGFVQNGRVLRAFQWRSGTLRYLPDLPQPASAIPHAVNASGLIVGEARSRGDQTQPVYWRNGEITRIPVPKGYNGGRAFAVNDRGTIAGELDPRNYDLPLKSFVWSDGKLRVVTGFTPDSSVVIYGIDELDRVYGSSRAASGFSHAIRIDPDGRVHDFGVLPGGYFSEVSGVSARGDVVGRANQEGSQEPFRAVVAHPRGTLLVLPSLGRLGRESDEGTAINDKGDAVGTSRPAGADRDVPVLWRCVFGQAQRP